MSIFGIEDAERNQFPMWDGLLAYFPSALAGVARVSMLGNDKHNPGLPIHHDRSKSRDHRNKILRHLIDGDYDELAWRALALSQEEHEKRGAPVAPGAYFPHGSELPVGSADAAVAEMLHPSSNPGED